MSLHPQTIRIRHCIRLQSQRGRKHWDLYRGLLSPFVLSDALKFIVKNRGSSGLDGQSIYSIKGKEQEFIKEIIYELKSGTFKPSPVKRVYIPKKDGSKRPLGIPNLKDRIIQRALVLLMEPIFEEKFHEFSYGFRPKRKAVEAAAAVAKECYRLRYVLDADIEKFFDEVHHSKMMGMLKIDIVDPRVLKLIKGFLISGFCEPGKPWQRSSKGTPQGGPLSPLLANIYLHHTVDDQFCKEYSSSEKIKVVRYADDLVILAESKEICQQAKQHLINWLQASGLKLKEAKTRIVDMTDAKRGYDSKFNFLGFKFHLRAFSDNPKRFWIARQPSEASRQSLRLAIRERLHVGMSLDRASEKCEEIFRGWCEYFRYSNANKIFYAERKNVKKIYFWWLGRKFRRQKKAVPWKILGKWKQKMNKSLRPPKVVPNLLSMGQQTQFK